MAAMTTALTEFSDSANSRTYTVTGHTALKPKLVLQKRKPSSNGATTISDTVAVVYATEDADGNILPQKVSMEVTIRRPILGLAADNTAALAVIRDIVSSDEFTEVVNGQSYLA